MKKYIVPNLLFTFTFMIIFSPLCYVLVNYLIDYGMSPVAAKESLSEYTSLNLPINRKLTDTTGIADQVTVLMYHQIIPENQLKKHHFTKTGELVDMVVTLEDFTNQMNYLKKHQYTVLTLKEFEGFMEGTKNVPKNSVLITFDDGHKNVFEFAYPVLKKHNFYATHFLITSLITNRTIAYDSSYLQYASIEELKKAADVFDYGSHSHDFHHRNTNNVAYLKSSTREMVKNDLKKANMWLGHTMAFAAPYGEYTTSTLEVLKELDVKMGFTINGGYANPSQHILEIPRQGVYSFYTMEDFKYIIEQKSENISFTK